jgi:hypothetical protein
MNQNPSVGRIAQELSGCFSLQHPLKEVVLEKAWYIPAEAILYRADPLPRSNRRTRAALLPDPSALVSLLPSFLIHEASSGSTGLKRID